MRLHLAIGVAATSATFAVGQELCDAGLWDSNVDEGDFDDASNWVDGDLPDNNEVRTRSSNALLIFFCCSPFAIPA